MGIAEQRAYYDRRWSAAPEELDEHQLARLAAIRPALTRAERRRARPWQILEVGCGTGWLAAELAAYGRVTGLDLSDAAIAVARERYPEVEFRAFDASAAPLPGGNDLVVASEVLEHVEQQAAFVERLVDAVAPGGFVLLTTPNGLVESRWRRHPGCDPQPVERWISPRELGRLLERRCRVERLTTFFLDFDRAGVYGLVHDPRLRWAAGRLGLLPRTEHLLGRLGLGLYMLALARRTR